jgi:NADH:ubiquinone oxidoreductase subunit 2 (subunit N)
MVHVGFIIYSISLLTTESISSAFFYLIFYILLILFLFSFIIFLYEKNNEETIFFIENISQIGIILNKNKILVFLLAFILFSFAGLPFFIGFLSK